MSLTQQFNQQTQNNFRSQDPVIGGISADSRMKIYPEQLVPVVLDDSGSMAGSKARECTDAAKALFNELADEKNRDGFRVSAITFGSSPTIIHQAQKPEDAQVVISGNSGGTNLAPALEAVQKEIEHFKYRSERRAVNPMIVVMTDGCLDDTAKAKHIADQLKRHCTIICIGYGDDADIDTLKQIATSDQHVAKANVGDLKNLFAKVGKTVSQQLQ